MAIEHDLDSAHDGPFGLHAARAGDLYRVTLTGEFDLAAVTSVQEAIALAFDSAAATVEIDLSQLTFLDSSGLRTIVEARDGAAEHAVELQLVRGIPAVQRVFEITGLDAHLPFRDAPCS